MLVWLMNNIPSCETLEVKNLKQAARLLLSLGIALLCFQNSFGQPVKDTQGAYELTRFTSKDKRSTILVQIFEKESKGQLVPGFLRINGVIHLTENSTTSVSVMPGVYRIECGYVGKELVTLKRLRVNASDSVQINFFLKDERLPLQSKK